MASLTQLWRLEEITNNRNLFMGQRMSDLKEWKDLYSWLGDQIPHASVRGVLSLRGRSQGDALLSLYEAESPYRKEIEKAVRLLSNGEKEPLRDIHGRAIALLCIRIETAKEWINQMLIGLESPIPFPSIPFPKFAQWLLIDWWNVHGISLYAQEVCREHNSELLKCWHKSCFIYECGFDSFCKFSLQ
jgi:hypothetical protein